MAQGTTRASTTRFPLLTMVAFAAACGPEGGPPASGPVLRDSAGITIVENFDATPGTRLDWTLSAAPRIDIGGIDAEGPYQLFRAVHALRLPDDRLIVANAGSGDLHVYDDQGLHVATWGKQGEGPGEYLFPSLLARWAGDSVAVWDSRLRRLSIVDGQGSYGRQLSLARGDWTGLFLWHTAFPDGRSLVTHQDVFREPPSTGLRRNPTSAFLLGPDGEVVATLPEQPGDEVYMEASEGRVTLERLPFLRGQVVVAHGNQVVFGPTDGLELRIHDAGGEVARLIRLDVPPRPITEPDVEAEIERQVSESPEDARAGVRARYERIPTPEFFPAVEQVLADPEGNLWAQLYRPPVEAVSAPTPWAVFAPDGHFRGRFETPSGLTVMQIGTDFIVGHANDELDVEHIQVWGLQRN
ncbi:MAG: 6-bladed beta-propeller [Gemmatimonadota bacterium]|nr:6-bladed beta-propeller [Gemmatimonadota bacterium]